MRYADRLRFTPKEKLIRPVKFEVTHPDIGDLRKDTIEIYQALSKELHRRGDGFTQWKLGFNHIYNFANNCTRVGHDDFDAELASILGSYDVTRTTAKRATLAYVIQNYKSWSNRGYRNGLPKTPFSFKNNAACRFVDEDCILKDNNQTLRIRFPFVSEFMEFPVKVLNNAEDKLPLLKMGGNIYLVKGDKYVVTMAIRLPVEYAYVAETYLGTDINQFGPNFVILSDGTSISLPDEVQALLKRAKSVWEQVNDTSLKSSQRSAYRRQWKNLRKRMICYLVPVAQQIVEKCLEIRAILCIDDVHVTGSYGFGNDLLIKELVAQCERSGIPHIIVPTKDTSRKCYVCSHVSNANRPNQVDKTNDYFLCQSCGHSNASSDHHAAINVAVKGREMAVKKGTEYQFDPLIESVTPYVDFSF